MDKLLCFLVLVQLYFIGCLTWNQRAYKLYLMRINNPWREAIAKNDWDTCDYFHGAITNYKLQDARIILNPIMWFKYWNWRPENEMHKSDRIQ